MYIYFFLEHCSETIWIAQSTVKLISPYLTHLISGILNCKVEKIDCVGGGPAVVRAPISDAVVGGCDFEYCHLTGYVPDPLMPCVLMSP